jgi:transcription initiation factor TFIID TATA-box-binding protein
LQIVIDIVNVVATTTLGCALDIRSIIEYVPEAEFNPRHFSGVILRLQNPKAVVLVFGSGKIISTGAKSLEQSMLVVECVLDVLRRCGIMVANPQTQIDNIVASVNLGREFDLENCAKALPRSVYEPDHFPAVLHKMSEPPATVLLYKNGKAIITGLKSEEAIFMATTQLDMSLPSPDI